MARMGTYCKAYPVQRLRGYPAWREVDVPRTLTDDDHLYLHDDYIVTDGVFVDENVVFDQVTDEWKTYCTNTLRFAPTN